VIYTYIKVFSFAIFREFVFWVQSCVVCRLVRRCLI